MSVRDRPKGNGDCVSERGKCVGGGWRQHREEVGMRLALKGQC